VIDGSKQQKHQDNILVILGEFVYDLESKIADSIEQSKDGNGLHDALRIATFLKRQISMIQQSEMVLDTVRVNELLRSLKMVYEISKSVAPGLPCDSTIYDNWMRKAVNRTGKATMAVNNTSRK
jgi:hypothetical protein